MEEIESFSRQYKAKLDEAGAKGDIPEDLALEVIHCCQRKFSLLFPLRYINTA